jgi:hypothetical protein
MAKRTADIMSGDHKSAHDGTGLETDARAISETGISGTGRSQPSRRAGEAVDASGRLHASDLTAATLSLKPIGEKNYQVDVRDLPVGQIIARRRSFGRVVWYWSLHGPHLPQGMAGAGSNAHTLQGAKAAVKSAFDVWLHAATGQRGDIPWIA